MNFASDNVTSASPEILAAIAAANHGPAMPYGADEISRRLEQRFAELFEHEVAVFPVATGTAANALALACLTPVYGAIYCHEESHIATDECGAPEFFTGGAKLVVCPGEHGKLTPDVLKPRLAGAGVVHNVQPAAISITQETEAGTIYRLADIAALSALARRHGLALHMDGARFANAVASLGCAPADLTWRAGVDALSFGATKNGCPCAEAVVFFDPARAADFEYRRKRGGHLLSKMRFVSAQLETYLASGRWLTQARRANELAAGMATALATLPEVALAHPVEVNEIFVHMPDALVSRLHEAGTRFYEWESAPGGRKLVRLVLSFLTPEEDIARFLEIASN